MAIDARTHRGERPDARACPGAGAILKGSVCLLLAAIADSAAAQASVFDPDAWAGSPWIRRLTGVQRVRLGLDGSLTASDNIDRRSSDDRHGGLVTQISPHASLESVGRTHRVLAAYRLTASEYGNSEIVRSTVNHALLGRASAYWPSTHLGVDAAVDQLYRSRTPFDASSADTPTAVLVRARRAVLTPRYEDDFGAAGRYGMRISGGYVDPGTGFDATSIRALQVAGGRVPRAVAGFGWWLEASGRDYRIGNLDSSRASSVDALLTTRPTSSLRFGAGVNYTRFSDATDSARRTDGIGPTVRLLWTPGQQPAGLSAQLTRTYLGTGARTYAWANAGAWYGALHWQRVFRLGGFAGFSMTSADIADSTAGVGVTEAGGAPGSANAATPGTGVALTVGVERFETAHLQLLHRGRRLDTSVVFDRRDQTLIGTVGSAQQYASLRDQGGRIGFRYRITARSELDLALAIRALWSASADQHARRQLVRVRWLQHWTRRFAIFASIGTLRQQSISGGALAFRETTATAGFHYQY